MTGTKSFLSTVDQVKNELDVRCKELGIAIIRGSVFDLDKAPSIRLGLQEFSDAIAAEKPSTVFWRQSIFDIDDWIESELENAGWDEGEVDGEDGYWPSLEQARKYLKPQLEDMQKHIGDAYFF